MSFEEEFDKIVRQKAEEANYPFDQANWEKASSMLDAGRKAAAVPARSSYLLPVSILVGIAGAGILAAIYFKGSTTNAPILAQTGQEVSTTSPVSNEQTASSRPANPEQNMEASSADVSQKTTSEPSTEGNLSDHYKHNTLKKQSTTVQNKTDLKTSAKTVNEVITPDVATVTNDKTNTEANQGKTENTFDANTANNQKPANDQQQQQDEAKLSTSTEEVANNQNNPPAQSGSPYSNGLAVTGVGADIAIESKNALQQPFILTQEAVEFIPLRSSITEPLEEELGNATKTQLLNWYEPDYYKSLRKYPMAFIGVQAGVSYLNGWKSNNLNDGRGFNWQAGLHAGKYFSKHFGLGLGLEVFTIQHITQPFYKSTNVQYSFGSVTNYTMLTSNSLYYLGMPLKAYLRLNKSNQLAVGVSSAWLMQSSNTQQTYRSSDLNTPVGPAVSTKGVYEGVNRINWSLLAEYQLNLTKRLMASAAVSYGLSDIFVNNAFAKAAEKPLAFRLGVQYNFIQK